MSEAENRVTWLKSAERDLEEILGFVWEERPSAALALAAHLEEAAHLIAANPGLGMRAREEKLARLGYRFFVVQGHLLFYTEADGEILVHRILHGARDRAGLR